MAKIQTPVPVWLDCDPGHDDVFAIVMAAYHPSIQLLGVSAVYGNASLKHTLWNATSILTAISKDNVIPVYAGAAKPVQRPPMAASADIHGETGLDGTDLLPEPRVPAKSTDLDTTLAAMASALQAQPAGTAWLVATGTLTNVALLFDKYPDLVEHIAGLSIMGGAVGGGFTAAVAGEVDGKPRIGNRTAYAEFNILLDPEAAAQVFGNPRVARKTTLVPLDLTHLVLATADVQDLLLHGPKGPSTSAPNTSGSAPSDSEAQNGEAQIDSETLHTPQSPLTTSDSNAFSSAALHGQGKTTLRTMLVQLLNFFADTYSKVFSITAGPPLHDPIAVAAVLTGTDAEIPFVESLEAGGTPERYEVTVVTDGTTDEALAGQAETGRTVVKLLPPGAEGVRIPRGLDIPLFWKVMEECCTRADAANVKNGR
ncbi:Uridine nucleosidase 1 [Sporothrix bragantina]|uniref:Uridine nucleosidase 1 n=1 Tax=Sporothrix bragantina TaxID=671064 RepID=A0ABP0CW77_9PEZI